MMDHDRIELVKQVKAAIEDKETEHDVLEAAVSLIDDFSDGYDWTGFYMMRGEALEVGPYIGPETPHTKIELDQGICGAAASQKQSIVVDDVNADPRFLACSVTTQSEIVVPLMDGNHCLGEIDIDSNQPSFFTSQDREMLEQIADVIVKKLRDIRSH
ncbi:MAG: GAF domain-containing protein [Candidatus Zixiibacteriota bacterium]|nr:MAG: GAF domain-containing protein [candidate division Zixibacteria bacterium]